jgi:hypothetical protein
MTEARRIEVGNPTIPAATIRKKQLQLDAVRLPAVFGQKVNVMNCAALLFGHLCLLFVLGAFVVGWRWFYQGPSREQARSFQLARKMEM